MLVTCAALAVALASGVGVPTNLLGSAPREASVTARPAEVQVVDGDTLRLGERVVRLDGVEAPLRGQSCAGADGRGFDCGAMAAESLARLVAERPLTCRVQRHDAFRRSLGACEADGVAVNAALVSGGWALAASDELAAAEAAARAAGRGLWARGGTPPQGWRGR